MLAHSNSQNKDLHSTQVYIDTISRVPDDDREGWFQFNVVPPVSNVVGIHVECVDARGQPPNVHEPYNTFVYGTGITFPAGKTLFVGPTSVPIAPHINPITTVELVDTNKYKWTCLYPIGAWTGLNLRVEGAEVAPRILVDDVHPTEPTQFYTTSLSLTPANCVEGAACLRCSPISHADAATYLTHACTNTTFAWNGRTFSRTGTGELSGTLLETLGLDVPYSAKPPPSLRIVRVPERTYQDASDIATALLESTTYAYLGEGASVNVCGSGGSATASFPKGVYTNERIAQIINNQCLNNTNVECTWNTQTRTFSFTSTTEERCTITFPKDPTQDSTQLQYRMGFRSEWAGTASPTSGEPLQSDGNTSARPVVVQTDGPRLRFMATSMTFEVEVEADSKLTSDSTCLVPGEYYVLQRLSETEPITLYSVRVHEDGVQLLRANNLSVAQGIYVASRCGTSFVEVMRGTPQDLGLVIGCSQDIDNVGTIVELPAPVRLSPAPAHAFACIRHGPMSLGHAGIGEGLPEGAVRRIHTSPGTASCNGGADPVKWNRSGIPLDTLQMRIVTQNGSPYTDFSATLSLLHR
jgi:hypothetical protein